MRGQNHLQKCDQKSHIRYIQSNFYSCSSIRNSIGGVPGMASMLTLIWVDHGFEPRSVQTKDY